MPEATLVTVTASWDLVATLLARWKLGGEIAQVTLLKALLALRVSTWILQARPGGLWSRSGRVSAKRRERQGLPNV